MNQWHDHIILHAWPATTIYGCMQPIAWWYHHHHLMHGATFSTLHHQSMVCPCLFYLPLLHTNTNTNVVKHMVEYDIALLYPVGEWRLADSNYPRHSLEHVWPFLSYIFILLLHRYISMAEGVSEWDRIPIELVELVRSCWLELGGVSLCVCVCVCVWPWDNDSVLSL